MEYLPTWDTMYIEDYQIPSHKISNIPLAGTSYRPDVDSYQFVCCKMPDTDHAVKWQISITLASLTYHIIGEKSDNNMYY